MDIPFPTQAVMSGNHHAVPLGLPDRARGCRCPVPIVDGEGGCVCGHWVQQVIDRTFADRARALARRVLLTV